MSIESAPKPAVKGFTTAAFCAAQKLKQMESARAATPERFSSSVNPAHLKNQGHYQTKGYYHVCQLPVK
jgi:hypothetical protein